MLLWIIIASLFPLCFCASVVSSSLPIDTQTSQIANNRWRVASSAAGDSRLTIFALTSVLGSFYLEALRAAG